MLPDAAGVQRYTTCRRPPVRGGRTPFVAAPCREGGSTDFLVMTDEYGGLSKAVFAVYTPDASDVRPLLADQTDNLDDGRFVGSYRSARRSCIGHLQALPLDLKAYSSCITRRYGSFREFSGLRGVAAIVQLPEEISYKAPGHSSPLGHLVLDQATVLAPVPGVELYSITLLLVAAAPVRLPLQ